MIKKTASSSWEDVYDERVRDYVQAFCVLYAIFCFFYATNLVSFLPSIDEERAAFLDMPPYWAVRGRWLSSLVSLFIPTTTIPFLPLATFGFFGTIAYLTCLRAIGVQRPSLVHYATFPLFIAFPTWAFMAEFSLNLPGIGLGLLLASLSTLAFRRLLDILREGSLFDAASLTPMACCLLATTAAIGAYQGFVPLQLTLYLGVLLILLCQEELTLGELGTAVGLAAVLLLSSLALYVAMSAIFLGLFKVQLGYIPDLLKVDQLVSDPLRILSRTIVSMFRVYAGVPKLYGVSAFLIELPLLFGVAGLLAATGGASSQRRRAIAAAVIAMLVAPFSVHPFSGGSLPARELIAVPAAMWFMSMLGFMFASRRVLRAALFLAPVVYFQTLQISSQLNANRALARTHDQLLAAAIYDRIARVSSECTVVKPCKVDFYGYKPFAAPFKRAWSATGGSSFFEWDDGNPERMIDYMRLIGFTNLVLPTAVERPALVPVFQTMPVWPAEGSVRLENGVVLVKLGAEPGAAYRDLVHRP